MKCQRCERSATIHITEITGDGPQELHLCEGHAREYLTGSASPSPSQATLASAWAEQFVSSTAEELSRLDQKSCPVCGITFYEFRNKGRFGCPHDYEFFLRQLEPLLLNIHGETEHRGKRPKSAPKESYFQHQLTELIRLRREMNAAVDDEDYERASELRDKIREIERGANQRRE